MVLFFSKNLFDFDRKVLSNFYQGDILLTFPDYQDADESISEPLADFWSQVSGKT